MREFEDIKIEAGKITTPQGQYPLRAASAVWVRTKPRNELYRWGVGVGAIATGVLSGGLGILVAGIPALGMMTMETLQVVVNTDGNEYVIKEFYTAYFHGKAMEKACELKKIIGEVIEKQIPQ